MVTLLRPHDGVRCPKLTVEQIEQGLIRSVDHCSGCDHKEEIQRPWRGYIVRCKLDGDSDNRTVEYS